MSWTKKDLETFDRLLTKCEVRGFDNYNRNIARLELQSFLNNFTEKEQNEMAKKIGVKPTKI